MYTNEPTNKTKPIEQFRLGGINASIWKRETDGKVFYFASIDRSYKNNDGKWKRTNSFSPEELPLVAQLAGQAQAYIAAQRSA
jgi:hypothetical protein